MAYLTPGTEAFKQANQQLAASLGFTGAAGGGGVDTWLSQNPQLIQQYTTLRQQQLEPGYTPNSTLQGLLSSFSAQQQPVAAQQQIPPLQTTTQAPVATTAQPTTAAAPTSFAPINQQIANALGFTGTAGGGAIDAWLAQNPQLIPTYTAIRQQVDPSYVPNTNLQQVVQPYINQIAPTQDGVVPVGQIEPLNQLQKDALQRLGVDYSQQFMDRGNQAAGTATTSLDRASPFINSAAQNLTPEQIQAGTQQYLNPYMQQVLDFTTNTIRDQGQRQKNLVKSDFTGNYGSSAQGTQYGLIDEAVINAIAGKTAELSSSGYNSALSNFLNQSNTEKNRNLDAASRTIAQSVAASDLAGQNYGLRSSNLSDQLRAGTAIQQQNQASLDILRPEIYAQQGYSQNQINELGRLLGLFPSSASQQTPGQSTATSVGGGILTALGLGQSYASSNPNSFLASLLG